MTKGGSLGSFSTSTTNTPRIPNTVVRDGDAPVMIEVNPSLTDKIRYNQSTILCCVLTTLLVGSGVGIAIWYAIVEI
tara:strand:+ start:180 stop:410 length:231 start_codon:yes stop_codon:yes gene_type:complete